MTQANAYSQAQGSHDHGHDEHGHDEPHVLPLSVYIGVWLALVVLTVITVAVSRFDFGSANTIIAMIVATIKGSMVALYFMHLRYDNKFNLVILCSSLLFVSIFFTPTLIDLNTRGLLDPVKTVAHHGQNGATAPAPGPAAAHGAAPAAAQPAEAPAAGHGAAPAAPAHPEAPAAAHPSAAPGAAPTPTVNPAAPPAAVPAPSPATAPSQLPAGAGTAPAAPPAPAHH